MEKFSSIWHGNYTRDSRYPNVVGYNYDETVPTLGEVRGQVVVVCKQPTACTTYYEDNYEWYGKYNVTPERKYDYLTNHLKKYTFAQDYYGREDKFIDTNQRNNKDAHFVATPVHAPMYINTNLTQIFDWETAILPTVKGPHSCWKELYYDPDPGYFWDTPGVSFNKVSLNPKTPDGKNQRTGWWRFDFPQNHQVEDIIASNYVDVNTYKIVIDNYSWSDLFSEITYTVKLSNGCELKVPANSINTAGTFDFGYFPAEEWVASVELTVGGKKAVFVSTDSRYHRVGVLETREDTFHIVKDDEMPDIPMTGDDTNLLLLAGMLALSLGVLAVLLRNRKAM